MPYLKDDFGEPVIRTLGSQDPDLSGYNPPDSCQVILAALQRIDPGTWEQHVPLRSTLYHRACPDLNDDDIAECVENELAYVRDAFGVLLAAYAKAVEKGWGVSCEYSL